MNILAELNPVLAFNIWGYDLRGLWVTEFTAMIAEERDDSGGYEWDRPEWLKGWYRDGVPYTPPASHALPWVGECPPSRYMWRPASQWEAELKERYTKMRQGVGFDAEETSQ